MPTLKFTNAKLIKAAYDKSNTFISGFTGMFAVLTRTFAILSLAFILSGCSLKTAKEAPVILDPPKSWYISGIPEDATEVSPTALYVQFGSQIAIDELNAAEGIMDAMIAFSFDPEDTKFIITAAENSVDIYLEPEGIRLKSFSTADTPEASEAFKEKYMQMFGSEPDAYAKASYECIYYLKEVLTETKAVPGMGTDEIQALFNIPEN